MRHITVIQSPVPLLFICLFVLCAPATSEGIGIGFGLSTGLSIPATASWSTDLNRLHDSTGFGASYHDDYDDYQDALLAELLIEVMPSEMVFYGNQAGLHLGGEIFLGSDQFSVGVGVAVFSKKRSAISFLSSPAEIANGGLAVRRLNRRLASILLSGRYTWRNTTTFSPYMGLGIGVYHIREQDPLSSYSVHEHGAGLQISLGLESALRDSRAGFFTEIALNLSGFEEDWETKRADLATVTLAVGIRFRI